MMSPYCRHALKRFQTLSTASHFSGGSSSKTATLPRDVRISDDFADDDLGCSPLLSTSPSALAQPPTRTPSSVKRRLFNSISPGHVTQNTDVNTKKQYHNTSDSQASPSVAVSVLSPLPVSKSLPTPVLKRRSLHFKELSNSPSITRRTLPHVNNTASSAEITPNKLQESHLDEQQRVIDILNTQVTPSSGVNVIGDFSGTHSLPTTPGYHSDVQYITPQTLESLLTDIPQEDKNVVIIDCRYPYEFNGGHIQGAVNIYTKETIHEELLSSSSRHRNERTIVIFHCEFSSERAPNMYRFLRKQDRAVHADRYPQLHYPEMYVLHGGYKAFYEQCGTEQCQPKSYRPMLHQQYQLEFIQCRRKTKMWGRYKSWHRADVQRVAITLLFHDNV